MATRRSIFTLSALALASTAEYTGLRAQVLRFLYEKQRKVENIGSATVENKRKFTWKSVA